MKLLFHVIEDALEISPSSLLSCFVTLCKHLGAHDISFSSFGALLLFFFLRLACRFLTGDLKLHDEFDVMMLLGMFLLKSFDEGRVDFESSEEKVLS